MHLSSSCHPMCHVTQTLQFLKGIPACRDYICTATLTGGRPQQAGSMCSMGLSLACISELPKLQHAGLGEMGSIQHKLGLQAAYANALMLLDASKKLEHLLQSALA